MYRNPSGCHVWCTLHHSQSGLSCSSILNKKCTKVGNLFYMIFWVVNEGTSRDLSLHLREQKNVQ